MTALHVPQFNSNDSAYVLVEWVVEEGQDVTEGQDVALLETSKAVVELVSPSGGVLEQRLAAGSECAVGDPVATVHPDRTAYERRARPPATAPGQGPSAPATERPGGCVVTDAARALAEENGVPWERLHALGRKVVKRAHVLELLAESGAAAPNGVGGASVPDPDGAGDAGPHGAPRAGRDPHPEAVEPIADPEDDGPGERLSPAQRAVAATVTASHRTIPTAFVALRVCVDGALEHAARLSRSEEALIGLPEMLVAAVARQRSRFPSCFATLVGEDRVRSHPSAHVGVTIDTGNGLFVATVRDAERLSRGEIARRLMEFRMRSVRGSFRGEDLADSRVAVSLHHEPDVVLARPLVFPGHTCSVVLPGALEEVVLDPDGTPRTRRIVDLGLAYDHRVLNGRTATAFLRALKTELEEEPGPTGWTGPTERKPSVEPAPSTRSAPSTPSAPSGRSAPSAPSGRSAPSAPSAPSAEPTEAV